MDRLIALLAALVGLIALGGALLVHNSANAVMSRQAAEIAGLKAALNGALSAAPVAIPAGVESAPTPSVAESATTEAVAALERRIASLEQTSNTQAIELAAARAALDARAGLPAEQPVTAVAAVEPAPSASSSTPAAYTEDGPTADCIPLGTRFMAQTGDSFPICKTRVVIDVTAVSDGSTIVDGAGPIAAGGFGNLPVQGCTVMVFTADTSGFAEMRVSCV